MAHLEHNQQEGQELCAIYQRYHCPAEMIFPCQIASDKGWLVTLFESRFGPDFWNMDSPWIASFVLSIISALIVLSGFAFAHYILHMPVPFKILYGLLPATMILSPVIYAFLVTTNILLAYDRGTGQNALTPTHFALTDSGFKMYVRGRFFYNYPILSLWSDMTDLDLITDKLFHTPAVRFKYTGAFGSKQIIFPLQALKTEADQQLVLQYFAKNVPLESQGPAFIEFSKGNFLNLWQVGIEPTGLEPTGLEPTGLERIGLEPQTDDIT